MGDTARKQQVVDQFQALSPTARAASNFLDTIGLAANSGTLGVPGRLVDYFSGLPQGQTATDAEDRVNNSGPLALGTAAEGIGAVAGTGGAVKLGRAGLGLLAGKVALPTITTAAKVAAPLVGALGVATLGGRGAPAADALPPAVATNPVATALAQGATAAPALTSQDELNQYIHAALGTGKMSLADVQSLGSLIPAATKPIQTAKDKVFQAAAGATDAQFTGELTQAQQEAQGRLGANASIAADPAYRKAVASATNDYRVRLASLLGNNPEALQLQAQQQLAAQQAE